VQIGTIRRVYYRETSVDGYSAASAALSLPSEANHRTRHQHGFCRIRRSMTRTSSFFGQANEVRAICKLMVTRPGLGGKLLGAAQPCSAVAL
jgi:hypothetical protein